MISQGTFVSSPGILDLPTDILERVLYIAAGGADGCVPFHAWFVFASVCRAFRAALYSCVRKIELADCYTFPRPYNSLEDYVLVAQKLLCGPVLRCHRLRELDIRACDGLHDNDIAMFVARASPLSSFTCTVCHTQTDSSIVAVARAAGSNLRHLDISGCDYQRHVTLSAYFREQAVSLPCSALSNTSLVALSTFCRELTSLTIANTMNLTDTAMRALATLPHLDNLELRRLPGISNVGIRMLVNGRAKLTSLSLLFNAALSDEALFAIAHGPATRYSLQFFGIECNSLVTNAGVAAVVEKIPTIDEIQIDHCANISESWTEKVASAGGLTRVSMRSIGYCLTHMGLERLVRNFFGPSRLVALNLGLVSSVNTSFLKTLLRTAPQVAVLVLDSCNNIDDDSVAVLGEFQALVSLDLSWCGSISSRGIRAFCRSTAAKRLNFLGIGPIVDHADGTSVNLTLEGDSDTNVSVVTGQPLVGFANGDVFDGSDEFEASHSALPNFLAGSMLQEAEESTTRITDDVSDNGLNSLIEQSSVQDDASALATHDILGASGFIHNEEHGNDRLHVSGTDLAFREIGARCISLRRLSICGCTKAQTLAWLRKNTMAIVDCVQSCSASSEYGSDELEL